MSGGMRFAYADPPYFGLAKQFYGAHHLDAADYDRIETHSELIDSLSRDFPDGWALSLHEPSLRRILPLCPDDCRVSPWVKPFASFKPNVNPAYAWEPVIWRGGRKRGRDSMTVRDYVSCPIAMERGFPSAKPDGFCFWLFELLGMESNDDFVDLFPGSGAVGRAWDAWRSRH